MAIVVKRRIVPRSRHAMKADRGRGDHSGVRDSQISEYRNGAEGMIKWVEDRVWIEITPMSVDEIAAGNIKVWVPMGNLPDTKHPETGRSYREMWEEHKRILRRALKTEHGQFVYRLIVLCWMRGEGKSLLACLIQLWKFFCFPRQLITLGANSKDQVKFVHFDIMLDIVRNSPELRRQVGERNLQTKEIRLTNEKGEPESFIRPISSFTGIVSNITGYTFSEMFDMKNPKYFVQLDGSVRNIPNALGVIDSTVSEKTHVLYQLFTAFTEGKTSTLFFSYRHSKLGDISDYWHPYMTKTQLDDYRVKFPFGEFDRYFLNLWSAGTTHVFTEEMIECLSYYGIDQSVLNMQSVFEALEEKNRLITVRNDALEKGIPLEVDEINDKVLKIYERLNRIDDIYQFSDAFGDVRMTTATDLKRLEDAFDTNFSLIAGIDRGDPSAVRGKARTITGVLAKGLPGSRSNPQMLALMSTAPRYVYFLLMMAIVRNHSLDTIKELLESCNDEFDGIDTLCSERYGAWDIEGWCEDRSIELELVYPSYGRQRESFNELYTLAKEGLVKVPELRLQGSKKDNILKEEMSVFDHNTDKKWFGSPEKEEKYGIQDDSVYFMGWAIYGGRKLTADHFRIRKSMVSFGMFIPGPHLTGRY